MTDNMESLLLGGSDSSDDDDMILEEVTTGTAAVPPAASVAASVAPPPMQSPTGQSRGDLSSRLKSLYSTSSSSVGNSKNNAAMGAPPMGTSGLPSMNRASSAAAAVTGPSSLPMTHLQQSNSTSRVSAVQRPPMAQPTMQPLIPNRPHLPQQAPTTKTSSSSSRHGSSSSSHRSSQPTATTASSSSSSGRDPFEPTPLKAMMQRHHVKSNVTPTSTMGQQPQPQSMPTQVTQRVSSSSVTMPNPMAMSASSQHRGAPMHPSSTSSSSSQATIRASNSSQREAKQRKERFLMFTRVLMKYLEQKDPPMHTRAKQVIRECAEKNKRKEAGYESVTASMHNRLRATVGDAYWKRAESYLSHFLKQKTEMAKRKSSSSSSSGAMQQNPQQSSHTVHHQQQQHHHQQQQHRHHLQQQQQQKQQQQQQQQLAQQQQRQRMAQQAALEKQKREKKEREMRRSEEEKQRLLQHKKKLQQQEQLRKQNQQQQEAQKAKHAARMAQISRDNAAQIAKITASMPNQAQRAAAAAAAAAADKKRPKLEKRKSGSLPVASSARGAVVEIIPDQPTREYTELMETLEHSINYDSSTAGLLMQSKADVLLVDEQRKLLYGSLPAKPIEDWSHLGRGWSQRNVLSVRSAWAKVRLPEQVRERKAARSNNPTVVGISLPQQQQQDQQLGTKTSVEWFNEDHAELDPALQLLSEATEAYLKQILEKALQCARQRQNLAGIRLWHMQHAQTKAPLGLRLGCDVSRQVALATGNAARVCVRMEQALERQELPSSQRNLRDAETVANATSMGELALRPRLASGAEQAEYYAKRSFEVSGGKESGEPPLGRVPKRAKITAHDFELGMEFVTFPHHRKGISSVSIVN